MMINFELTPADLEYFRKVMLKACETCKSLSRQQIIDKASETLTQVRNSNTSDFIRERMDQLSILIDMLTDLRWNLDDDDSHHVLAALSYFSNPQDLIPDDLPVFGFLDDAIMVQIVSNELQHEMQAYQDFLAYIEEKPAAEKTEAEQTSKTEWMEERREQLHSRMRRRRAGQSDGNISKSPFSLF
jgi:uncharacterized membrane protein YkvA (DUF1232 family)